MKRFIEGIDRSQSTLFPDRLEDYIGDDYLRPYPANTPSCAAISGQ
ncbi:MAG: hypothetical protein ACKVHX_07920 [Alphaproteobacteria bacterium]|jgi:hypothetical protein